MEAPKRSKGADQQAYKLNIMVYDRDILKSADFLAQFELDLKPLFDDCRASQKPTTLDKKYYQRFFRAQLKTQIDDFKAKNPGRKPPTLDLTYDDDADTFWLVSKADKSGNTSRIRLDIRLVPGSEAEK